jgi:hypothetical protein
MAGPESLRSRLPHAVEGPIRRGNPVGELKRLDRQDIAKGTVQGVVNQLR